MKSNKQRAKKSLRTILMLWLLTFSVVPLAFITGYSLVKYEQAIDQELHQRLIGNRREIQVILQEFQKDLENRNRAHAADKSLIYYLSSGRATQVRELGMRWMRGHFTHHLSVFNREGKLEVALYRDNDGEAQRQANLEGVVFLSDRFVQQTENQKQIAIVDFASDGILDLIMFSRIVAPNGMLVGYIEEILRIDQNFISSLKNRLGIEIAFYSGGDKKIVTSHDDLRHYREGFFADKYNTHLDGLFDLAIRDVAYGFMIQPINWGDENFYIAIGASKQAAKSVLKNVNYAFFTVVGFIVAVLIVLSFIFSKMLLQPLNDLVELVQTVDFDQPPTELSNRSDNEIGILTDSFNIMAQRVYAARNELKENIKKLEVANVEIRETQAKLVHTAKMASLGQLVAGVAHELNNPISFIYSNMAHLRDYAQKLIGLVDFAEKKPDQFAAQKEVVEFDYIVNDMPKLIKSCEEGARRTRDIVVGLRNFSRLDEAKLKEVDIHEGIDSTLGLLEGEFKPRIKIKKQYGKLPSVHCYPSQLNQVFMNILSNAIHAIKDQGEITVTTAVLDKDHVQISIRDTGIGMNEETLEKMFDPFFTTKEINSGTGLGMSITYGVIQKHNGEIKVKSKLGQGTEFIITLPVHLAG